LSSTSCPSPRSSTRRARRSRTRCRGSASRRLGFTRFSAVRQGKRFELEVEGPVTEEILAAAREAGEKVLSNPVIEDVVAVYEEQG